MDSMSSTQLDQQFKSMLDAFAWRLCCVLDKRPERYFDVRRDFVLVKHGSNLGQMTESNIYALGYWSNFTRIHLFTYSISPMAQCSICACAGNGKTWDKFRFEYSTLERKIMDKDYVLLDSISIPLSGKKQLLDSIENCRQCGATIEFAGTPFFKPTDTIEQILVERDLALC